jgi:Ig-like domain CHU_C associated
MSRFVAVLLLACAPIFAQSNRSPRDYPPLPQQKRDAVFATAEVEAMASLPLPPATLADGCVTSSTTCNAKAFGRLAVGDCTSSAGAFSDNFTFTGKAGDFITFTARPLSPSYTGPTVSIAPPAGDASKPVVIGGDGSGATVVYVLSSSGQWRLGVSSLDLFASGDYVTSLTCEPDPAPELPQQCVTQSLLCGQAVAEYLTNQSCRFSNDQNFVYADFEIYAVPGDPMNILFTSTDFEGRFGVIRDADEGYLATSAPISSTQQVARFTAPAAGFYNIVVTSQEPFGVGAFGIAVSCAAGGCLEPLIVQQPQSVTVPYGQRASLQASASGSALSFDWFGFQDFPSQVGAGASFQTPPATKTQFYYFTARNQCGTAQSDSFSVGVSRRRAAAH